MPALVSLTLEKCWFTVYCNKADESNRFVQVVNTLITTCSRVTCYENTKQVSWVHVMT